MKKAEKNEIDRRRLIKGIGALGAVGAALSSSAIAQNTKEKSLEPREYDLDEEYNRLGFNNIKWDFMTSIYSPYNIEIPMGVADMDFRVLPQVTEALKKRITHETWGYEIAPPDYFDTIIKWNKNRYGQDIEKNMLLNCIGVWDGIAAILNAFGEPGDKVIMQTPGYSNFFAEIAHVKWEVAQNVLKRINGRYEMDFDDLQKHITDGARVLILCNPHNPTGNCWTVDELRKLGDFCIKNNVLIISDEIHCDFVNKHAKYTSYATIGNEYSMNSITIKSTSKSFNLAAFRTAYMFSHNEEYISKVIHGGHIRTFMNVMGLVAADAAYKHGAKYLDDMQIYIDGNAKFLQKTLYEKIPLIKFNIQEGTFLAWLDCSALIEKIDAKLIAEKETAEYFKNRIMRTDIFGTKSLKRTTATDYLQRWLVINAGVLLNAGERYGNGGEGFMRMNIGTTRSKLTAALSNIEKAVNSL